MPLIHTSEKKGLILPNIRQRTVPSNSLALSSSSEASSGALKSRNRLFSHRITSDCFFPEHVKKQTFHCLPTYTEFVRPITKKLRTYLHSLRHPQFPCYLLSCNSLQGSSDQLEHDAFHFTPFHSTSVQQHARESLQKHKPRPQLTRKRCHPWSNAALLSRDLIR